MQQRAFFQFDSVLVKGVIILVLTLLMLIPINLIVSLIDDRARSSKEVSMEISEKWGQEQEITGPILVLPVKSPDDAKISETGIRIDYISLLPDMYDVSSKASVEKRSRSIYSTLVYQSENTIKGSFNLRNVEKLQRINPQDIFWNDAYMILGISDMKGVKNRVAFNINGETFEAIPGTPTGSLLGSGMTINIPLSYENYDKVLNFSFDLNLNGSRSLEITPVGRENRLRMTSDWNTISFSGDFLPTNREINNDGFSAEWDIFDYNRNYNQVWIGNYGYAFSKAGVDLKFAVDQYQMNIRSVKYAIMFIFLTFVAFFFIELITKTRIHPVQYTLVSLSLIIFYTLLIALSEHINFHLAYLVSSIAIVTMITLYVRSIFTKWSQTFFMAAFISAIYFYLYILLQLEELALLAGAVGLFVALGIIMYVSRKINWYNTEG